MSHVLLDRPAWYVIGPLMGLVVVVAFALLNERVGVTGGFSDVVERVTGRRALLGWKAWFLFGVVGGGLLFRLLAGGSSIRGSYGWVTRAFDGGARPVAGLVLVVAGVAIGYGAKLSGGCTSGNGLGGCSTGSRASIAATATFMATAIAVSFLIEALV